MSDEITAYVTKYALTRGIATTLVTRNNFWGARLKSSGWRLKEDVDWFRDPAAAARRANELRTKKIANLKKQIAKLEAMTFTIKDMIGE